MEKDSKTNNDFLIIPWGANNCETEVMTVSLPSREIIVQAEVPINLLENIKEVADSLDLPTEEVLADRLEMNLAKVKIFSAIHEEETEMVRRNLNDARFLLSGVKHLETTELKERIKTIWGNELNI